jgi:rhamnogalacturonyl hydrolase YesR
VGREPGGGVVMAKKAKAKSPKARSNAIYVQKLLKKHGARGGSAVVSELDKMVTYLLTRTTSAMNVIATTYDKKSSVVKPKLAQAAFQSILDGELRASACEAGAEALVRYANAKVAGKLKSEEPAAAPEAAA